MISTSEELLAMATWDSVRAPKSLAYRIKLLAQLATRRLTERLDAFGLTPFHWLVLCCLWEEDGLPTSSIGERLQQVGGTLTGVIDRMEERGLVQRERDTRDRRVWRIWLTDAGKDLESVLPPVAAQVRDDMMQGIPPEQRELFSQILDQAIANLSLS